METKQSMYAARVEMRLAKERLEVLKTFTDLEMSEAATTGAPAVQTESTGISRKRNREEDT
jgi:hypothetical protein